MRMTPDAPIFRQLPNGRRADSVTLFFHPILLDQNRLFSCSFSAIDKTRYVESLLEYVLLMNAAMHRNREDRKAGSRGLVMRFSQDDSRIARDRSAPWDPGTDRCLRCGGFTVAWCDNVVENAGRRCVQCGELIDPVILQNRQLQHAGASGAAVK